MRNKKAKLIKEVEFKKVGQDIFKACKPGKQVTVDRHALDLGAYIIWADRTHYARVGGEDLHLYVEFV